MNNTLKIVLAVVVLGVITYLGVSYPKQVNSIVTLGAVGATFNDAKIAAVSMSPSTSAATSTFLTNNDAGGRWVSKVFANCTTVGGTSLSYLTGLGIANLNVQFATTSSATQIAPANLLGNLTVSTSTAWDMSASTTVASASQITNDNYYWAAGSNLQLTFNATNTAACVVGVDYMPS